MNLISCNTVIATHSPFILSLGGVKIYDLDEERVEVKRWNLQKVNHLMIEMKMSLFQYQILRSYHLTRVYYLIEHTGEKSPICFIKSAERKMNMIKFKVEILIDEDMVIQDDEYELDDMYEYIKDKFRKYNLNEVETDAPNHIIFTDAGDNRDFGGFWSAIWDLYGLDWFKKYALKFAWYNYVEERVEDILVEGKRLGM